EEGDAEDPDEADAAADDVTQSAEDDDELTLEAPAAEGFEAAEAADEPILPSEAVEPVPEFVGDRSSPGGDAPADDEPAAADETVLEPDADLAPPEEEPAIEVTGDAPPEDMEGYLEVAILRLREGKPVFGERLFVMGSGPLPSLGEAEGTMGLDAAGGVVLLVAMPGASLDTAAPLIKELDEIGELTEEDLSQLAEEPGGAAGLKARHGEYFLGGEDPLPDNLNDQQRAILLLEQEPSEETWEVLLERLGDRLAGVYVVEREAAWTVTPTETETVRKEEQQEVAAAEPPRVLAPQPKSNLIWLGIVVIGVALAIWGLSRAFLGDDTTPGTGPDTVASPVRNVAVGTSQDATHTQWIGQHHLLRTSDGRLLTLYRSTDGLNIVADRSNAGRQWRNPVTVGSLSLDSFSAAIDEDDNIHIGFHDGSTVSYAVLQQQGVRWRKTGEVELDTSSTSPVVEIAWDEAADVAHVVWAKDQPNGQQPFWASVSSSGVEPTILESQALARPGTSLTALITIDADDESNILATYRRPDEVQGWFSRSATPGAEAGTYVWSEEEQVPTQEGIGAASVATDPRGVTHLVLRDSTTFELAYYTKRPGQPWSDPEQIVDANSTDEIDFPSISLDTSSRLIYVFFQTNQSEVGSEVHVAVHDPATGWEPAYNIAEPSDIPTGAHFPTSIATVSGQPIVLWTTAGDTPAVQAARVSAP
ncbi:MAG: hypothetical protein QOH26_1599, partial [Actinomycetota bacterium]|nr:hypothetical protein [Actinomycetota bacterium]